MDADQRMTRAELVRALSEDADVRPDVVRDVLAAFTNIAVSEIVNRGAFQMDNLFRIASSEWAGYTAGGGHKIPPHSRLSVKLPETLRTLYKYHNDNPEIEIGRDNWRPILKELMDAKRSKLPGEKGTPIPRKSTSTPVDEVSPDDFNPILDDDE